MAGTRRWRDGAGAGATRKGRTFAVGVIGFYTSIQGMSLSSLIYAGVVLAICAAIEAGNRMTAAKTFEPTIEELNTQIRQLEEESND